MKLWHKKKRQPSQQSTSSTLRRCVPLFVYNYIVLLRIYQVKLFMYWFICRNLLRTSVPITLS